MARVTEECLENTLSRIVKLAEEGGYMKKEIKNDILEAVSEIRKCFETLKTDERCE